MDRAKMIQIEQVEAKLHNARERADDAWRKALSAKTSVEYHDAVREGCKAGYDYSVWYKVLAAIS